MSEDGGDERGPDGGTDDDRDRPASRVTALSLDSVLELLANFDRRHLLDYLRRHSNGTATVAELVDYLAEKRAERTDDAPDLDADPDRIETKLHHVHIPKLADAGVVEFDDRSGEIRYWGEDRLEAWHDRIRCREDL